MTNKTEYTQLKLRDLKILAAEKGVQPVGDLRKKDTWLIALFEWDAAEAEPYIPTLEEQKQHLEHCYGSYGRLEESIGWLGKVDIFGKTHKQKLDRLVEILLNYEKQPRNIQYLCDYISVVSQLSDSLFIAKDYRDTFKCDYHPILSKRLDALIEERLQLEADLEKRRKEQEEARKYQRQYNYFTNLTKTKSLQDYLKVLELPLDASPEEAKRAYRQLSKKYHPDMPGGSADSFIKLQEAYECAIAMMANGVDIPF